MSKAVKTIATVAGAVAGFFLAPVLGVAAAIGVIGGAAVGFLAADTISAIFMPDIPGSYDDSSAVSQNAGVTLNKQGTNVSIPVVYGRRKIGGARVFISSNGDRHANLYMALVLCEGEIAGLEKIYIDDTLVWDGGLTSHGSTYAASGKYANLASFQVFHGQANQTASSLLKEAGSWNDTCRLQGLAYIACKFTYPKATTQAEQDANPWSGLPNVTCQVRGRLVPSVAAFGSSVTRSTAYANETFVFSDNPVDVLLDYLRNPIYGKGLGNEYINFATFYNNRIKWDQSATGSTLADSLRHKFNGVIFTDRTVLDNTKAILQGMRSSLTFSQGRYRLVVEDNGSMDSLYYTSSTSVMTLNHNNIIGSLNIESESASSKYNSVVVTYMGGGEGTATPTYDSVELTWPTPDSSLEAQYLAEDNNRPNARTMTLEHITQASIAQKMAEIVLNKSRTRGKVLGLLGDSSLTQLEVGDIVTVQYGYSTLAYDDDSDLLTTPGGLYIDGKFRVTNISINNDFTVSLTCAEHDDNVYGGDPVVVGTPKPVIKAPAGSNIVADIYLPGSAGIPQPDVTFGESAQSVNGATASFYIKYVGNGSVYETDVYIQRPEDPNLQFVGRDLNRIDYSNYGGSSWFQISGLRYNTQYTAVFQHRNAAGSVGISKGVTFTTVNTLGAVQPNPYNQLTVFS